jgi:excisionase family DNA binding protein
MTDRLLTVDDVAELTGMGRDWLYAQVRAGQIPHIRMGRYVRFREGAIDEWLTELERRSKKPTRLRGVG